LQNRELYRRDFDLIFALEEESGADGEEVEGASGQEPHPAKDGLELLRPADEHVTPCLTRARSASWFEDDRTTLRA